MHPCCSDHCSQPQTATHCQALQASASHRAAATAMPCITRQLQALLLAPVVEFRKSSAFLCHTLALTFDIGATAFSWMANSVSASPVSLPLGPISI